MIVSNRYEYLFISNPKTCTHTMYHYLPLLYSGKRIGRFHERNAPANIDDYCVFTTIREPFERTVAIWNSVFSDSYAKIFNNLIGSTDFSTFVDFVTSHDGSYKGRGSHILPLQSAWLQPNLDKIGFYLRTDNLNDDFSKMPFATGSDVFEAKLQRNHATWDELKQNLTPNQIGKLTDWLAPDIELWGNV